MMKQIWHLGAFRAFSKIDPGYCMQLLLGNNINPSCSLATTSIQATPFGLLVYQLLELKSSLCFSFVFLQGLMRNDPLENDEQNDLELGYAVLVLQYKWMNFASSNI